MSGTKTGTMRASPSSVVFASAVVVIIVVVDHVWVVSPANFCLVQFLVFDKPLVKRGHLFLHGTRARLWYAEIGSVGLHERHKGAHIGVD